jgi:hypothetical protein
MTKSYANTFVANCRTMLGQWIRRPASLLALLVVSSPLAFGQPYDTAGNTLPNSTALSTNGQGSPGTPQFCQMKVGWSGSLNFTSSTPSTFTVYANVFFTGGSSYSYVRYVQYSVDGGARQTVFNNPGGNWGGWNAEIGEWRVFTLSIPKQAGNHSVTVYSANGYTGSETSGTFSYSLSGGNNAPTVAWHTLPGSTSLDQGSWYPARATGSDTDGNLGGVWVEYSTDGGSTWVALAYDPAGANGGNGYATTSNNNSILAGAPGTTYRFRCYAWDTAGANSGWTYSGDYTVAAPPNQSPTLSQKILDSNLNELTPAGDNNVHLSFNAQFYIRISSTDPEGRLFKLYSRIVSPSSAFGDYPEAVVSGASASHDFGPYTANELGQWNVWSHAQDLDAGAWNGDGHADGWNTLDLPDVVVSQSSQSTVAVNSSPGLNIDQGQSITFTASGGSGTINYTWGGEASGTGSTKTVTFNNTGTYQVSVHNPANGGYSQSNTATAVVQVSVPPDTTAPTAPTGLQITSSGDNQVQLNWNASSDAVGVAGYNVYVDGTTLRTTVAGAVTQVTVSGFVSGSTSSLTVKAFDAAGNESGASNTVSFTAPAFEGLGDWDEGFFYLDIDEDGILDRVSTTASPLFSFHVSEWTVTSGLGNLEFALLAELFDFNMFNIVIDIPLWGTSRNVQTTAYHAIYQLHWYNSITYTFLDIAFNVKVEAGETVAMYAQPALSTESMANTPWPINTSRWYPVLFNDAVDHKFDILTSGILNLVHTLYDLEDLNREQYFMVRYGKPIRGVNLDIAGEFELELGLGDVVEAILLPSGMTIDTGTVFGEITLDTGAILTAGSNAVAISTGGSVAAGSSTTIGGNTVSVGSAGEVTISTSDGLTVEADLSSGEKSITTSSGWGVKVGADGQLEIIIPPGASPTAKIVAQAIDTLGKIVQVDQGANWSVKDLLGNIISIPPTGTPLDLLDLQIGSCGITAVGIKPSPEGNTIWFNIPPKVDIGMAVDANRDNVITFDGSDKTDANNYQVFWLNNDSDYGSDDEAEDYDPSIALRDNTDLIISNKRDLEDFMRLHLNLPCGMENALKTGDIQLSLAWQNVVGSPVINLFVSAEVGSHMTYLTSDTTATIQREQSYTIGTLTGNYRARLGRVEPNQEYAFPADYWHGIDAEDYRYLLFEGVGNSGGRGELTVILRRNGEVIAEGPVVHLDLKPMDELYQHFTVGDSVSMNPSSAASEVNGVSELDLDNLGFEDDYILFVHGWRMHPWERRHFAETAFKRLYWQGYKGRFGLFSWPTEWASRPIGTAITDTENYMRSDEKAMHSAQGLAAKMNDLMAQYNGQLKVFAHSMGNVVVSEALLKGGNTNTYVACQSASVARAYDAVGPEGLTKPRAEQALAGKTGSTAALLLFSLDGHPDVFANYPPTGDVYYKGIKTNAPIIINHHNRIDDALAWWLAGQATKPNDDYYYEPTESRWYRDDAISPYPDTVLVFPADAYEILSRAAEPDSVPLGASVTTGHSTAGEITGNLDLNSATFDFQGEEEDHSAQFRSTIQRRGVYWEQLMRDFELLDE